MDNEEAEVRPFNIFMTGNIALEYKNLFESLAHQSALKLEATLSQLLQKEVFINESFEIKQKKLTGNHCNNYFRSWVVVNGRHDGFASVVIERNLSSCILDILCGGTGAHTSNNTTEDPSSGERRSLLILIKSLFKQTEDVFSAITPFNMVLTSKAQDAMAERLQTRGKEFICSVTYEIAAGDGWGELVLEVPSSIMAKTALGRYNQPASVKMAQLKTNLEAVPLPITVTIGKQESSLRDVLSLSPGDIIPLDDDMDAELYVCGKHFHNGKIHAENGQLQLRIAEFPEQPEPVKEVQDDPPAEEITDETRRNSRRSSRERRSESTANSTPTQTRSERREARLSGRRKTRTQGDS